MIMADLKTNYVDDVLDTTKNQLRKYQQIQNDDGTVSFVDVTEYTQVGTSFGAKDINDTNAAINDVNGKLGKKLSARDTLLNKTVSISSGASKTIANNIDTSSYKYVEINGYIIPTEIMDLRGNISLSYTKIHWESGMSYSAPISVAISIRKDGDVTLYMEGKDVSTLNKLSVSIYGYK